MRRGEDIPLDPDRLTVVNATIESVLRDRSECSTAVERLLSSLGIRSSTEKCEVLGDFVIQCSVDLSCEEDAFAKPLAMSLLSLVRLLRSTHVPYGAVWGLMRAIVHLLDTTSVPALAHIIEMSTTQEKSASIGVCALQCLDQLFVVYPQQVLEELMMLQGDCFGEGSGDNFIGFAKKVAMLRQTLEARPDKDAHLCSELRRMQQIAVDVVSRAIKSIACDSVTLRQFTAKQRSMRILEAMKKKPHEIIPVRDGQSELSSHIFHEYKMQWTQGIANALAEASRMSTVLVKDFAKAEGYARILEIVRQERDPYAQLALMTGGERPATNSGLSNEALGWLRMVLGTSNSLLLIQDPVGSITADAMEFMATILEDATCDDSEFQGWWTLPSWPPAERPLRLSSLSVGLEFLTTLTAQVMQAAMEKDRWTVLEERVMGYYLSVVDALREDYFTSNPTLYNKSFGLIVDAALSLGLEWTADMGSEPARRKTIADHATQRTQTATRQVRLLWMVSNALIRSHSCESAGTTATSIARSLSRTLFIRGNRDFNPSTKCEVLSQLRRAVLTGAAKSKKGSGLSIPRIFLQLGSGDSLLDQLRLLLIEQKVTEIPYQLIELHHWSLLLLEALLTAEDRGGLQDSVLTLGMCRTLLEFVETRAILTPNRFSGLSCVARYYTVLGVLEAPSALRLFMATVEWIHAQFVAEPANVSASHDDLSTAEQRSRYAHRTTALCWHLQGLLLLINRHPMILGHEVLKLFGDRHGAACPSGLFPFKNYPSAVASSRRLRRNSSGLEYVPSMSDMHLISLELM